MILAVPDSFKGSLSSIEASEAIQRGFQRVLPEIPFRILPLADGGEGTVSALSPFIKGKLVHSEVSGPLPGQRVNAAWLMPDSTDEPAVIEMAAASGLPLLSGEQQNPLQTTTTGTGELIREAWKLGCREIILGLGGSATCDGGAGALSAMGWSFRDSNGRELKPTGGNLNWISSIEQDSDDPLAAAIINGELRITAACDVSNPLHGRQGAAEVFAPQKGADRAAVLQLRQGLLQLDRAAGGGTGADQPGAGAAGGLGWAVINIMRGQLIPGFEILSRFNGLAEALDQADLVITGEGRFDSQSRMGKVTGRLIDLTGQCGKPLLIFCGSNDQTEIAEEHVLPVQTLISESISADEALQRAADILESRAAETAKLIRTGLFSRLNRYARG